MKQVRKAIEKHMVEVAGTRGDTAFEQALAMQERGEIEKGKSQAFRRILEPIYGPGGVVSKALDTAESAIGSNQVELHGLDGKQLVTPRGGRVSLLHGSSGTSIVITGLPGATRPLVIGQEGLHLLPAHGLSAAQWVEAAEELLPRIAARAAQHRAKSFELRDQAQRRVAELRPRRHK